ncbi:MAG: class A beta-lactamase-related serine hydrolase [Chryseobacterium sp.]|nr:MAG: class A beta-lactamase-related serine hydrolase [Chryseobacterium sp.]
MKKLFFVAYMVLSTAQLCAGQTSRQTQQLDSIFSLLSHQNQFSGSVIIAEKGKIVLKKGYGFSNGQTKKLNNPETIFETASCSKQFTAAAIVLLKRQGKLSYEDNIGKFIPELNFWGKVTILDLLRHTSGLPDFMGDMQHIWDKTKIATNADMISFYAKRRDTLQFGPNSRHEYSNTNYAVLASIIERASGRTYANFLSENIFRPLKMKSSFVYNRREHPKKIKNYATGYVWANGSFDKVVSEDPGYGEKMVYYLDGIVGHAKVNSSVEDMLRWVESLKTNSLLTQKEFEQMTEVTKTSTGKNIPYGFGLDVSKREDRFSFGHTGSWDGYISFSYHNVIKDRTIIVLENFKLGTYPFKNINEILDGLPISKEFRPSIPMAEDEMKAFIGNYIDEQDTAEHHVISYKKGHLIYNTNKTSYDMRFFPISANEFQGIRQGGADGVLRFTKLDNGKLKMEMLQNSQVIGTGTSAR